MKRSSSFCLTTEAEEFLATENTESTEDEESVVEGFSVFSGFVFSVLFVVKIFISFKTKPGSQPVARVFQESTPDRMSAAW